MYFGGGEKGQVVKTVIEIPGSKRLTVDLEAMQLNGVTFKEAVESMFCPGILPQLRLYHREVVITMPDGTVMTVRDSHRGLSVTFKERWPKEAG